MTQRPLAALTLLLGLISLVSVFLPWYTETLDSSGGTPEVLLSKSGLHEDHVGRYVLAGVALGLISCGWFTWRRTGPLLSRSLLGLSLLGFAVAAGFGICAAVCDSGAMEAHAAGARIAGHRTLGVFLATGGAAGAFLLSIFTTLSPKTP